MSREKKHAQREMSKLLTSNVLEMLGEKENRDRKQ